MQRSAKAVAAAPGLSKVQLGPSTPPILAQSVAVVSEKIARSGLS